MTCCLNPDCQQPQNPDDAEYCLSCGSKLVHALRGRYRITRPLGQGGFGRTYLAVDDDRLSARCVIKQFSPQVKGTKSLDKAIKLFQQEAERLNELGEHPQIPTLQAYFEHDQRLYLVQQFIEGQTLLQELAQYGIFGERRIREVLAGVLPVLKFVHDHQVIHRDITPSNIIRRFSDNKLVLIDFGVAKLLSAETSSQPGTKIGTEGYAPMEQLRGGKAYPASDIYSLGATCIYLLTQTKPDDLYDPLAGRWLWRERLLQQGGSISDSIAQILNKMLKDLVSERYQSADAVMRDLRMALSRPLGTGARTGAMSAAHPSFPPATSRPISAAPSQPPSAPPSGRSLHSGGATSSQSQRPISAPRGPNPVSGPPISGSSNRRCLLTLTGHSRWVTAVAVSPDGKRLASAGLDDAIKIWNLDSGELLLTLRGHTKPVNCLAISPDCQILVSGSDDHTLKIWNLATGSMLQTLHGHSRDVNSVVIHAGGQLLASGSEDRTARLWRLGTGEPLHVFSNLAGMIRAVAISPDGQLLASGGLDNQIKLWSLKTGTLSQTFTKSHYSAVNAIAFTPNGNTLISASKDKTIKLWNVSKGEVIRTLTGHTDSVNSLSLTYNGKLLVSGSSDTTIKIWNAETGDLKGTLADHISSVNAVSISPDGRRVVSGSSDTTVKVWQVV
ncbi:MAG: serine/threonine-protein kinase [Leptolyngbyaceae cyanobacterium bins.349]|nr:serine/threonine-protein kinase [Leptolyngbyaceae cyanobacterium bins.349]